MESDVKSEDLKSLNESLNTSVGADLEESFIDDVCDSLKDSVENEKRKRERKKIPEEKYESLTPSTVHYSELLKKQAELFGLKIERLKKSCAQITPKEIKNESGDAKFQEFKKEIEDKDSFKILYETAEELKTIFSDVKSFPEPLVTINLQSHFISHPELLKNTAFIKECKKILEALTKYTEFSQTVPVKELSSLLEHTLFKYELSVLKGEESPTVNLKEGKDEKGPSENNKQAVFENLYEAVNARAYPAENKGCSSDLRRFEALLEKNPELRGDQAFVDKCTKLADKLTKHPILAKKKQELLYALRELAFQFEVKKLENDMKGGPDKERTDEEATKLYEAIQKARDTKNLRPLHYFRDKGRLVAQDLKGVIRILMENPNIREAEKLLKFFLEIAYDPKNDGYSNVDTYKAFMVFGDASVDIFQETGKFKAEIELLPHEHIKIKVNTAKRLLSQADAFPLAFLIEKTYVFSKDSKKDDVESGRTSHLKYPFGQYFKKLKGITPANRDILRSALILLAAKKGHRRAFEALIEENRTHKNTNDIEKNRFITRVVDLFFIPVDVEINYLLFHQETNEVRRKKYLKDAKDLKEDIGELVRRNIMQGKLETDNLMAITAFIEAFKNMLHSFSEPGTGQKTAYEDVKKAAKAIPGATQEENRRIIKSVRRFALSCIGLMIAAAVAVLLTAHFYHAFSLVKAAGSLETAGGSTFGATCSGSGLLARILKGTGMRASLPSQKTTSIYEFFSQIGKKKQADKDKVPVESLKDKIEAGALGLGQE